MSNVSTFIDNLSAKAKTFWQRNRAVMRVSSTQRPYEVTCRLGDESWQVISEDGYTWYYKDTNRFFGRRGTATKVLIAAKRIQAVTGRGIGPNQ